MPQNINMIVETKYKLVSIKDSTANFSISMTYTMDMDLMKEENIKKFKILGSGDGSGNILYSIKNHFPIEQNLILNFNITTEQTNDIPISIETHIQTISNHKTAISKL